MNPPNIIKRPGGVIVNRIGKNQSKSETGML